MTMTEKISKIQIRAGVFAAINVLCSPTEKYKVPLDEIIKKLSEIEDKDFLARLLIKEFISTNDTQRASVISLILIKCIPVDILEKNLWSNLALKTVSDEKKYQLVEILKSMGKFIEYDKYLEYFDEPQTVIDLDTQKLLKSAMLNPEAQIDFLDFMETLPKSDKKLLINSMVEDYSKDDLANIIGPIILYETDEEILEPVINELINSKSALAYYPLTKFCDISKNEDLKRLAQKGLKELQLAGINEQTAKEFYDEKFSDSIQYMCYSSMLDGNGNQGLLFSRIRVDNSIQVFCVVINDLKGIIDCFGFNTLSNMEFSLIVQKFGGKGQSHVVSFESALLWVDEAEKLSVKKDFRLPYEYVCWKEILFDVNPYGYSSDEIIHGVLNILPNAYCDLDRLYATTYLDKLFFTKDDSEKFNKFMLDIDEKIANSDSINLNEIENIIQNEVKNIFDETATNLFKGRLLKIAFILMSNSDGNTASEIYELTNNKNLLNEFFVEVLKKSIFVYYEQEFKSRFSDNADNIFVKKFQKPASKLDNSKLQSLLEQILADWGRDG